MLQVGRMRRSRDASTAVDCESVGAYRLVVLFNELGLGR
jgi:hypothetical protein